MLPLETTKCYLCHATSYSEETTYVKTNAEIRMDGWGLCV